MPICASFGAIDSYRVEAVPRQEPYMPVQDEAYGVVHDPQPAWSEREAAIEAGMGAGPACDCALDQLYGARLRTWIRLLFLFVDIPAVFCDASWMYV